MDRAPRRCLCPTRSPGRIIAKPPAQVWCVASAGRWLMQQRRRVAAADDLRREALLAHPLGAAAWRRQGCRCRQSCCCPVRIDSPVLLAHPAERPRQAVRERRARFQRDDPGRNACTESSCPGTDLAVGIPSAGYPRADQSFSRQSPEDMRLRPHRSRSACPEHCQGRCRRRGSASSKSRRSLRPECWSVRHRPPRRRLAVRTGARRAAWPDR